MKIIALLTVYNEALFIRRCLQHLRDQEISVYLIDNGSTDNTRQIAEEFLGNSVLKIDHLPRRGIFELEKILLKEEAVARELNADWYIHLDADEIRLAPNPYRTLREGIEAVDRMGYNAINFDEFVFVPTSDEDNFENDAYPEEMQYYYFFEPKKLRRLNAWKNIGPVDLHSHGGHKVNFPEMQVYPENFILRHYISLSRSHLIRKFCSRVVSETERGQKGWNNARASLHPSDLRLPAKTSLKELSPDNTWDRSQPLKRHIIFENSNLIPLHQKNNNSSTVNTQPFLITSVPGSGEELLAKIIHQHPAINLPENEIFLRTKRNASNDETSAASIDIINQLTNIAHSNSTCRLIHLVRDGRDILADHSSTASSRKEAETAAGNWIWTIAQIKRVAQLFPNYLEIHYRDLCEFPVETLQRIYNFLEIDNNLPGDLTDSAFGSNNASSQRTALSPEVADAYKRIAATTLANLGYSLQ